MSQQLNGTSGPVVIPPPNHPIEQNADGQTGGGKKGHHHDDVVGASPCDIAAPAAAEQQLQLHLNGVLASSSPPGLSPTQLANIHACSATRLPPVVTITSLKAGEPVDVFHRYSQDPNGYFMAQHRTSGILHPSVGLTDGWTTAVISANWDIKGYSIKDYWTWPEIRWSHPLWYNRRGHKLDCSKPEMITQRVNPDQIRQRIPGQPTEAQQQPCLTLLHVRWGGEQPVNPVTEGAGGWGAIGSTPSDNYISSWENAVFQTLGPTYEIISAFYQGSDELAKIHPSLLRHMMRGSHFGACYFSWPIVFQDGHEYPAYVNNGKLLDLMIHAEASGIPTRFPHPSHLYKIYASKEWTSQMCLHPKLRVPLTTKVTRQSVASNPQRATATCLQALEHLSRCRSSWAAGLGQEPVQAGPIMKGVAKLGWSWEAMDVQAWTNPMQLEKALSSLLEQPGSLMDYAIVQEWVDFDVEIRHFVVEPDLADPKSWKAKAKVYTVFNSQEDGSFRNFDKFDRQRCLEVCFQNDEASLAEAERQAEECINNWLQWLQAQSAEMPVVTRFDIMAKRTGPGTATIRTGELTELGACFLGWPQGPEVVFGAMIRSCFKDPV